MSALAAFGVGVVVGILLIVLASLLSISHDYEDTHQ